jgi:hypothetical protein
VPVHPASEKRELFRATPESLIRRRASENRAETPDGGANSQIKITLTTQDNPIWPLFSFDASQFHARGQSLSLRKSGSAFKHTRPKWLRAVAAEQN